MHMQFIDYLLINGVSSKTAENYQQRIAHVIDVCDEITLDKINHFIALKLSSGVTKNTVNQYLKVINHYIQIVKGAVKTIAE